MELWTWQSVNWDIRCQNWNPERAAQTWGKLSDRLKELYAELQRRFSLPEGFLWCYLCYTYWLCDLRKLWWLEVPSEKILCYVNGRIWDQLSQQGQGEPSEGLWASLLILDVEAYCSKRFTEASKPGDYLANLHPNGVAEAIKEEVSALIAVPIPDNWVKENNRLSIGTNGRSPAYHELPTSLEEAQIRSKPFPSSMK
jgi:hypothetical protein